MKYPGRQQNGNQNKEPLFNMYWMQGIILLSLFALSYFQDASQTKEVNWTDFEKAALSGEVDKILVFSETGIAEGYVNDAGAKKHRFDNSDSFDGDKKIKTTIPSSDKIQEKIDSWNSQLQAEGKQPIEVTYEKGSDLMKLFWYFGPILLLVIFMV